MTKSIIVSVVFTAVILAEVVLLRALRLRNNVTDYRSPWEQT